MTRVELLLFTSGMCIGAGFAVISFVFVGHASLKLSVGIFTVLTLFLLPNQKL